MKKILCLLLIVVFLPCLAANAENWRVFDNCELFTEQEIEQLENKILLLYKQCGVDFAILTTDDFVARNREAYLEFLYYDLEMGVGQKKSGAIIQMDMKERYFQIMAFGSVDDAFEKDFDAYTTTVCEYLAKDDYFGAADKAIEMIFDLFQGSKE